MTESYTYMRDPDPVIVEVVDPLLEEKKTNWIHGADVEKDIAEFAEYASDPLLNEIGDERMPKFVGDSGRTFLDMLNSDPKEILPEEDFLLLYDE